MKMWRIVKRSENGQNWEKCKESVNMQNSSHTLTCVTRYCAINIPVHRMWRGESLFHCSNIKMFLVPCCIFFHLNKCLWQKVTERFRFCRGSSGCISLMQDGTTWYVRCLLHRFSSRTDHFICKWSLRAISIKFAIYKLLHTFSTHSLKISSVPHACTSTL